MTKKPEDTPSEKFENLRPDGIGFRSNFLVDGGTGKYFDEIELLALNLRKPLDEYGFEATLILNEELNCHALWSNSYSGCLQRGISLIGTEAMFLLIHRCLHEGRPLTVPIPCHSTDSDLTKIIIGTQFAVLSMQTFDHAIQELGATLTVSTMMQQNDFKIQNIKDYEEATLNAISNRYFSGPHAIRQDIFSDYEKLKRNIRGCSNNPAVQLCVLHALITLSLMVIYDLPYYPYRIESWIQEFTPQVLADNLLTNTYHRFQAYLEVLPSLTSKISAVKEVRISEFRNILIKELPIPIDPEHFTEFIYEYFLENRHMDELNERKFFRHLHRNRLSSVDFRLSATFTILNILKPYAFLYDYTRKDIEWMFGSKYLSGLEKLFAQDSIRLLSEGKSKSLFQFPIHEAIQQGRLKNSSKITGLLSHHVSNLVLWYYKTKLFYYDEIVDADDYKSGEEIELGCPLGNSNLCENSDNCLKCDLNPIASLGFDPYDKFVIVN